MLNDKEPPNVTFMLSFILLGLFLTPNLVKAEHCTAPDHSSHESGIVDGELDSLLFGDATPKGTNESKLEDD